MLTRIDRGLAIIVLLVGLTVFALAQLENGKELIPIKLKSINDEVVTIQTVDDKLIVEKTKTVDGKEKIEKFYPDVLLIDFWATWCPPCREAIPHLQKLHEQHFEKKFKGKEDQAEKKGGLLVVGIGLDRTGSKVIKPFVEKAKLTYLHLAEPVEKTEKFMYQPNMAAAAYLVQGIPTMYLIDSKGIIRHSQVGFGRATAPALDGVIEKLLNQKNGE